ncbi:MAG: photosystem II manganese-stabilizing polypeptide [Kaiparowitsia implicata GSE-PSE-MK54-09C]|jgi:photosystem II oxygen-evolving enhancer protein 1|nr:photosystem II manganese-stabilizing polypeptide [Kaiparowitsia implicata GSE-PSE-MK54-09C]
MRYRALIIAFFALCMSALTACSSGSSADGPLSYEEIRNTGLANSCPEVYETKRGSIPIEDGSAYRIAKLCLQPDEFAVKTEPTSRRQEARFIDGKPLTRYTTTIDQVSGDLKYDADHSLVFIEEDGFDFQATTVLLPGGEEVPFLFTIKGLVAKTPGAVDSVNTSTDFEGAFKVPSYRTSNFLDPKGRGLTAGYDSAVALPAQADDEELQKENKKQFVTGEGTISLQVTKVDSTTGEISGSFESLQPSDTDMGGKEPLEVRVKGRFYARVEPA